LHRCVPAAEAVDTLEAAVAVDMPAAAVAVAFMEAAVAVDTLEAAAAFMEAVEVTTVVMIFMADTVAFSMDTVVGGTAASGLPDTRVIVMTLMGT
jgi:hypothetical protein